MRSSRVYFIATIITISVLIMNQLFIQYWLHQKKEDANVINIGGRQRMLSQRLVALTYTYQINPSTVTKNKLDNAYQLWNDSHELLLGTFVSERNRVEANIHQQLLALTPLIDNAEHYVSKPLDIDESGLNEFILNQDDFLIQMDGIVKELEIDSERKLHFVIIFEIIFFLISLLLVIYEIVFVFKRISNNLQEKNEALRNSNELLEQYAFLAAHDLKTPSLNALNFAKVLKNDLAGKIDEKEELYFDLLIKSTKRLNETTNDLLQLSSVNNGSLKLVSFAPKDELDIILSQFHDQIQSIGATVNIGNLPSMITADKYLLGLVFQNLISNALKFVPKERKAILDINYQSDKSNHHLIFSDNGIGIPNDKFDEVFGLFKRLHRQDEYAGSGIGLSICNVIMQKHHGEILMDSNEGKGSIFTLVLPKHRLNSTI